RTVLKGVPSSFTLELPPYRRPQIGKVIVRSMFDRTLFVLARAIAVAAPAGLLIWLMANLVVDGRTLLQLCSGALDPLGRLMGLDGVILMAFILGFPANEIVLPIILMAYLQSGYLLEMEDTSALLNLLTAHGWTMKTFVCMAIFSLFHWPCSTTCLTIKKETGSWRWTAIAFLLPTLLGFLLCVMVSSVFQYI
ncbi:MAG: ferrous iron transporter B, partial [Lachnospiraceae bacterium]|nr:ferrous iron transporter B [Lachnospiraceae bacterium]